MLPEGWHTITPRIVVPHAREFVDFLRDVFKAEGDYEEQRPTVVQIGDSKLMVTESGVRQASTAFLYVYVANTEETYDLARKLGATTIEEPTLTPYGDRRCMIEDRWGNIWQIATYRKPNRR